MNNSIRGLFARIITCLIAALFVAQPLMPVLAAEDTGSEAEVVPESNSGTAHDQEASVYIDTAELEDAIGNLEAAEEGSPELSGEDLGELEENIGGMEMSSLVNEDVENDMDAVRPVDSGRRYAQVRESSGALELNIPIVTPPGRNGFDLDLQLEYSSQERADADIMGYGWSTNVPYIERLNLKGTNSMYATSTYASSLSGELSPTATSTIFGSRSEDGSFVRYEFLNNVWTATDKEGTVYKFGSSTDSRTSRNATSTDTYRWMLDEIRDTNGNYATFTYIKDLGKVYPYQITYSNHASSTGIFAVEFLLENSATSTSMAAGYEVVTRKRVSDIVVKESGTIVRKYELDYATGDNGRRVLLQDVVESGADSSSVTVTLPAVGFGYQSTASKSWTGDGSWAYEFTEKDGIRYGDVNGDGLMDVVYNVTGEDAEHAILINNGDGWDVSYNAVPGSFFEANDGSNDPDVAKYSHLVDLNGDAQADIIDFDEGEVFLGNGNAGWVATTTWAWEPGSPEAARLGDVNGDGLVDIVSVHKLQFTSWYSKEIKLNTGSGWENVSTAGLPDKEFFWESDSSGSSDKIRPISLVDLNGDGLADLHDLNDGYAYLNQGNLLWTRSSSVWDYEPNEPRAVRYADVNGDGLTDILRSYKESSWTPERSILLNTGNGWSSDAIWEGNFPSGVVFHWFPNSSSKPRRDYEVGLVDFDGDGVMDVYDAEEGNFYISNGSNTDVLVSVENGKGGTTDINYTHSALLREGSALKSPDLPMNVQVVSAIENSDSYGTDEATEYDYLDGFYYYNSPTDRKFAGFGVVETQTGADSVSRSYFHQGATTTSAMGEYDDHWSKMGRVYRTEKLDGSSNLLEATVNKWDKESLGGNSYYAKLTQTVDMSYEGDSSHKDGARSFTYDAKGNLTQQVDWGEVAASSTGSFTDTGTDKVTMAISYASSTAANIYVPSQETITNQSSTKIRETRKYYDTLSLGALTKANMTKREDWKSGSSYVDVESSYNGYGLVTQEKDPRDKITTYAYDAANLYVATSTNPVGHVTTYAYDYSLGKPKAKTDANGRRFQTTYDGLDRVTEEKAPDIASPSTLVTTRTYEYDDDSSPNEVHETEYLTATITRDNYAYLDGFGREIQARDEMEDGGAYAVTDTEYDDRGLVKRKSIPYLGSGSARTSATTTGALYASFQYDPVGRVEKLTTAVGSTTNSYDDWKVVTTDPNGKQRALHYDSRDRLVSVDEYVSGVPYSTDYEYNGIGNLTKITDALGNVRNFTYDGLGRRTAAEDLHSTSDGTYGTWVYTFDDSSNVTRVVDAKGQTIDRTYDDINRRLTEDYTGSAGTEITFLYDLCADGKGRLCSATTTSSVTNYEYNALGLQKKEAKKVDSSTFITDTTYDRQGNPVTITYPDSSQVRYGYNAAGQLETIEQKESGGSFAQIVSDFDYYPGGQMSYKEFGNGVTTSYTRDMSKVGRLTNILTKAPVGMEMMAMSMDEPEPILSKHKKSKVHAPGPEIFIQPSENPEAADEPVLIAAIEPLASELLNEFLVEDVLETEQDTEEFGHEEEESFVSDPVQEATAVSVEETATTTEAETEEFSTEEQTATSTSSEPEAAVVPGALPEIAEEETSKPRGEIEPAPETVLSFAERYANDGRAFKSYELVGAALTKKDERMTITLGDMGQEKFVPKMSMEMAAGSTFGISPRLTDASADGSARFENDKLVFENDDNQVRFYELEPSSILKEGGFEIDVVLREKSQTNTFTFDIESDNLKFYYQGALSDEIAAEEGVESCTETRCYDSSGNVVIERPEEVVGSYAAYYENGVTGDFSRAGGENYGTGKAFHIMRPKISDANGKTVWGTLDVDEQSGTLSVEVPQEFLDTASYPVIVDPTFGYGSIGGTNAATINAVGSRFVMPENGTVTQLTQYTKASSGTINAAAAVYSDSSGAPDTLLTSQTSTTAQGTTASWVNIPVTGYVAATGTPYWLWGWGSASRVIYWDTGDTNQYNLKGMTWPTWNSSIVGGTSFARKISIYATYTSATTTNSSPSSPTGLLAEGLTNPSGVSDSTPELSAIYEDADSGDVATHYQIQVATSTAFSANVWDTGKTSLASSTSQGSRIADVSYAGSSLASSTTYYWRIKFWDDDDAAGSWSGATSSFTIASSTPVATSTTVRFYANSGGDGEIYNGESSTWSTVHDASSAYSDPNSATAYLYSQHDGAEYWIARAALPFDTSSLPDNAVVATATLGVYVDTKHDGDNDGNDFVRLVQTTTASDTALSDGDFDAIGSVTSPAAGAADTDITSVSTGGYLFIPLNSTGKGWVSLTGHTKLGLREGHDAVNNAPSNSTLTGIRIKTSNATGTSTDPYLEITYTLGGGSGTTTPPELTETIQDITYVYDPAGNITQVADFSQTGVGKVISFGYDDLYRLVTASTTAASSTPFSQSYAYDILGNLTSKSDVGSYVYSGTGYANPHAATSIGGTTQSYDANGNLTGSSPWGYSWDYRNRLSSATSTTSSSAFSYDHQDIRIKTVVDAVTTYVPNKFYEIMSSSSTKSIYAGDMLIATVEGSGSSTAIRFAHEDNLSSVTAITNMEGETVQVADYYPFGALRIDEQRDIYEEGRKYVGQQYDKETDLNYMNARYENGTRGKFISQDPVFQFLGDSTITKEFTGLDMKKILSDPQSLNSYSYAVNNPINKADPKGLWAFGLNLNGTAEAGAGFYGGGTYGMGLYIIVNNDTGKVSFAKTETFGAIAGIQNGPSVSYPGNAPENAGVLGALISIGVNGTYAGEVNSPEGLQGRSDNLTANAAVASFQSSKSPDGTEAISVGGGAKPIGSVSNYPTQTEVKKSWYVNPVTSITQSFKSLISRLTKKADEK